MTIDELPTEQLNAAGATIKRIGDALSKAADDILVKSTELAIVSRDAAFLKDVLAHVEALKRADISTAVNPETKRPLLPNLDAQNAAVNVALFDDTRYQDDKKQLQQYICKAEVLKAEIVRLHEQRKDVNVEKELIIALSK